jgi:hypothetical protein
VAEITFNGPDVRKILDLPNARAVRDLIDARVLRVTAYTPRGRPLFGVSSVRRAALHVTTCSAEAPPAA